MLLKSRKVYSLILFALLGFSIFLSLPFLNFSPGVPSVYADSTNSGFNFFTEAINIDVATGGAWTDNDVSAHVPVGTTGVIIDITNEVASRSCFVREKGSTDDWYALCLVTNAHKYAYVGLDENRVFQCKGGAEGWETYYLVAYMDSSVTMFTDGIDYSIVPTGSWETVDLSSDVPSGATGVIMLVVSPGAVWLGGVRHPDSTDTFMGDVWEWGFMLCGINSAREIELYIENINVDHYLMGYTNSPVTFNVNWDDVSIGAGGWTDIDVTAETSADANGVIIFLESAPAWRFGNIRENGAVEDRSAQGRTYVDGWETLSCGLDVDNILEGKVDNADVDFYVVGYAEIGETYPVNEAVVSNSEFAQNVTIGWINVSVSHTDGYGNISDVVTTINTTGGELVNLTWWNTPEGDIFEKTYDPINMIVLLDDTNSFTTGSDIWNISWNVAFRRGTVGFCDVNVTSTSIEDLSTTTEFANEFYLSDFLRATGLQWDIWYGNFASGGWDWVAMDDAGDYVAVSLHYNQTLFVYNSDGDLENTFYLYSENVSFSAPVVEMSGDGRYVMSNCRIFTTKWNFTIWDRETEEITYTEQTEGGLEPVGSYYDVNYNGSLIAMIDYEGGSGRLKLYNTEGLIWNCSTMNGIALPTLNWVSVSRTGDVISAGSQSSGGQWPNASVFRWNSSSSEPMWVFNSTVATSGVHDVEVSETGDYICATVNTGNYLTEVYIFESSSSSNITYYPIPGTRTWNKHFSMDFVAQETKNIFYISVIGDDDATDDLLHVLSYNLTSDTILQLWNYSFVAESNPWTQMSNIMHNDRYYLIAHGTGGVYYWDTTSNITLWTYTNGTKAGWYGDSMNRDGNRFAISTSKTVASSNNGLDFFGYEGELPFFVGSANITNMEGCGTWIFSDERFYNFEGNFTHVIDPTMLSHVGLRFTDGYSTFYLWYNISARSNDADAFSLAISPQFDADKSPGAIDETGSSTSYNDAELTVVWKFWPTMFCFDTMDIDIYGFMNDTLGNQIDWSLEESDLFNLYVLGGFTNSTNVGDAGQYQGRSPFDIYTADDSSVLVEVYYRKLTHVHLKYKIWVPDGFIDFDQNWTLDIGMDYCFYEDDTWYKGWKTQIQTFGGSEIATGNNKWINYTVEHYRYEPITPTWEPMKQGKMYAFWEGFESGKDFFQLYTDLWFSSGNRSRMWGARVNSVYFGMKNEALFGMGWLFGNDWRAMIGNFTDLSHKDMIRDYIEGEGWGNDRYTTEIVMCRFWMNLSRPDTEFPFYVRVQDYSSLDFNRLQSGQFEGIDDPILIETSSPYMGEPGGLLGNFFGWLMEQASFIVEGLTIGLMAGVGVFVSFLDTLFGLAGWENGASTIVSWITSLINIVISAFSYLFDILSSLFGIMATWLVLGIQRFISLGSGLVIVYDNLSWIYLEASAGWVDVSEIITPLLPLFPLAYFVWLLNSDNAEVIFRKVKMSWDFLRSIAGFFIQIGQYTIQLISSIIEAIQW